jgi:predicted lipoprotein with Yx(FWY)xxD motif
MHERVLKPARRSVQRAFTPIANAARMDMKSIGLGLVASALLAGCSGGSAASGPPQTPPLANAVLATAIIGGKPAFVNSAQHAVYTFDGDTIANQSTCSGSCAAVWPPVAAPKVSLTSPFASFRRGDGSTQLSYNGKPLYTFVGDTQPNIATGDGVNGFHVARPLPGTGNGVPPGMPGYHP